MDNGPPGSPDFGFVAGPPSDSSCHEGKMVIPYSAIPGQQWALPREDWQLVPESARKAQERNIAEAKRFGTYGEKTRRMERTTGGGLREDGWGMLRPTAGSGLVLTKQFVFEGDRLQINVHCNGDVRVELLNPLFEPDPAVLGRGVRPDPIHSENRSTVWHTVMWKGRPDVRALWNKPVMARFQLREASLYAFPFVHTQRN